jgi:hypothetical protein
VNRHSLIIFFIVLALWLPQTQTQPGSWNDLSRLAAIESLVERGTWRIDASPYAPQTGDKIVLDGHYYSDKPPLFTALGAVLYAGVYYGLEARLAGECQPGVLCVYHWLTVMLVGLPSALLAAIFYRLAWAQLRSTAWAAGLTGLLCFGTMVWPYSLTLNNHLPAAAALFGSFYLLTGSEPPPGRHLFGAGLLVGIAVMFELITVFPAFALFVIGAIPYIRPPSCGRQGVRGVSLPPRPLGEGPGVRATLRLVPFIVGAAIPALITVALNYQITGAPLFPYMIKEGYDYPGSALNPNIGGLALPDSVPLYTCRALVGDRGLFAYCPLLLLGLAGLLRQVRQGLLTAGLLLAGIAGQMILVLTQTDNFGGDAYGVRHFLAFVPLLYFFTVFVVPILSNEKWLAIVWGVAAVWSLFSAYQGVRSTWNGIAPPLYVTVRADWPYIALQTNLALPTPLPSAPPAPPRAFTPPEIGHRLDVEVDGELRLLGYDLPARRVQPGEALEITLYWQSLRVTGKDYFVFTHLLDIGFDRRLQEGYPVAKWYPGEVVADRRQIPIAPDAPGGLAWLRVGVYQMAEGKIIPLPLTAAGDTSIAIGPILIGRPPQVIAPPAPQTPVSVALGEPAVVALRGYDLSRDEAALRLRLYWESLAPTPTDWTLFVHLRDGAGAIVAQADRPAGGGAYLTSFWQAGEFVAEEVIVPLEGASPPGLAIFVGLYDPGGRGRLPIPDHPANEIKIPLPQ